MALVPRTGDVIPQITNVTASGTQLVVAVSLNTAPDPFPNDGVSIYVVVVPGEPAPSAHLPPVLTQYVSVSNPITYSGPGNPNNFYVAVPNTTSTYIAHAFAVNNDSESNVGHHAWQFN